MSTKLKKLLLLSIFFITISTYSQKSLWEKTKNEGKLNGYSTSLLDKNNSELIKLNFTKFKEQLINAPKRSITNRESNVIVPIPNEKGKLENFMMYEASVFSESLSEKYPKIKSYVGFSTTDYGTVVRMSISPKGISTMISYKDKPTVFMQPLENSVENYIVYNKKSKNNLPKEEFICSTADELLKNSSPASSISKRDANDQILRKFRIAVSVNGEYTTFHGGTVAGALAAINTTLTRVNAVFETDMAITFELQDFPALIYTDAITDPYSTNLDNWNSELQSTLNSTIGDSAYDIGHMFGASGGGGSAGCIGCVCEDGIKGSGITSPSNGIPQGDTFDIDYVAHEIGHQMGANHTFSHSTEGAGVNSEPGSGSTIMGYAGITSSNVQQNSDDYFHYHSIRQIMDNITNTRTCWQNNSPVTLTNNPPSASAGQDYVIPKGTAYVLRGTATDADSSNNLTYCWEQTDSGQVTKDQFGPTRTVGAQARSLLPTSSSDRYIPKLSRVITGQLTETDPNSGDDWETVSTVGRDLNWALTVRDRMPTATGLNGQTSFDTTLITVDAIAGPFTVTSQTTNETWDVGSTQVITWDVAGTDSGNVNTTTVNIKMSVDGGITFPHVLASNVSNDGNHSISVPATGGDTSQARVMVEGNNNIFYAVNSSNFSIQESEFALSFTDINAETCHPADATYSFTYNTFLGFTGTTTFSAVNLPTGATISFNPTTAVNNNTNVVATVSGVTNLAFGDYNFMIKGTSGSIEKEVNVALKILSTSFNALNLTAPTNTATEINIAPELMWNVDNNATSYDVQIATDSSFSTIVNSTTVSTSSYIVTPVLSANTLYYWRVKPKNNCGEGSFSPTFSFTTETPSYCASTFSQSNNSEWISNVTFNTINNNSGNDHDPIADDGYQDFTSISTSVNVAETYEISVTLNTVGYQDHVYVFIDWNQDYIFNTSDERYDLGTETDDDGNTLTANFDTTTFNITVPNDAVIGNTRMRVVMEYDDPDDNYGEGACNENHLTGWGETEDYTIEVQNSSASVKDYAFEEFNLYPNPSNGEINLSFNIVDSDKVITELYDIRGRKITEKVFKNVTSNFSERLIFDTVSTGIYLLRIKNGGKQTTKKIIIK